MSVRLRTVAAAAVAGIAIVAGAATPASATAMDYRQYHGTYPSSAACHAEAQKWIWPNNPTGADYYTCEQESDGVSLYLYFLS